MFVIQVCEEIDAEVHVMIRPRGGDFLYTTDEVHVMMEDIKMAKQCGAQGVVLGILDSSAHVNKFEVSKLVKVAKPMKITFHRAFDTTLDPFQALEDIISCGVDRILTSGQKQKATEGVQLIAQLVERAQGRINIMAGSGVNSTNVRKLVEDTGVKEVHLSGHSTVRTKMGYIRDEVAINGNTDEEFIIHTTDEEEIRKVCNEAKQAQHARGARLPEVTSSS